MNRILLYPFICLIIFQFVSRCASPTNPTGGPKDTIPPKLLSSDPPNNTLNFSDKTITLEFDERISAEKLKSALQVTPSTELNFSHLVKKNIITIKLEDPLEDSTTYSFNFFNGITDITEKNPPDNLILAISTGQYIDSLSISGTISDLLTQKTQEKILVGLYSNHDTIDVQIHKPRYFTKSDEEGNFNIQNIKNGIYELFVFKDDNDNLKLDYQDEPHAFLKYSIKLVSNLDSVQLNLTLLDISPLTIQYARPFGRYFEIKSSKPVTQFEIHPFDTTNTVPLYQFIEDQSKIRIYNTIGVQPDLDSIRYTITLSDTVDQTISDTLFIKFNESSRKLEELTSTSTASINHNGIITGKIDFNKPISTFYNKPLLVTKDSLSYPISISDSNFHWNDNHTSITYNLQFDWSSYDSFVNEYLRQNVYDSIIVADTSFVYRELIHSKISYTFDSITFISIENDTAKAIKQSVSKISIEDLGSIQLEIITDKKFILELTNGKEVNIRQSPESFNPTYDKLPAGKYNLQFLIDSDSSGTWSSGNYLKRELPEPLFIYHKVIDLKANWEIIVDDISF